MKYSNIKQLLMADPAEGGFTPPKNTIQHTVRVDLPKEPSAEVLKTTFDDSGVNFDSDPQKVTLEDKSGAVKPADVVSSSTETTKVEEAPKTEEKKEETTLKGLRPPGTKKAETPKAAEKKEEKPIAPPSKDKIQRDYTGYTQEQVAALKGMSNEAYKYVTGLIKENTELAKQKDSSYLQHPQAFMLSPEYQKANNDIYFANAEYEYWKSALISCDAGKAFKMLKHFDAKGQPVYGEDITPTKEIEESCRMNMNVAFNVANQFRNSIGQLQQNFQNRVKSDLSAIQQERAKRFAWIGNPEVMKYEMDTKEGVKTVEQVRNDFMNIFPSYQRNSPGVEVAADLMVALMIQHNELQDAIASKTTAETKQEELKRGEPGSVVKPAAQHNEVNGVREFSMSDLPV